MLLGKVLRDSESRSIILGQRNLPRQEKLCRWINWIFGMAWNWPRGGDCGHRFSAFHDSRDGIVALIGVSRSGFTTLVAQLAVESVFVLKISLFHGLLGCVDRKVCRASSSFFSLDEKNSRCTKCVVNFFNMPSSASWQFEIERVFYVKYWHNINYRKP